ncbi:carotenoid biosynthesis protein [Pyxidicoccus parkwayensis]|uniref:Carotenoid biosynthesis protein n=1 Tax=Pyxidicoccus parkwayensis TaxID=2813578 RepID=A0ABX7NNC8_9BACT|nr:glycosyltransferase [Pyxidicoccus parkwaysis]QSQ20370.1 carotenoid biosynthesis protein [Pyxidicoccus parkwaysis]
MSALVIISLAWTVMAMGFSGVALARLLRVRRSGSTEGTRVPVLLLRPVDAPTPRELENLATPIDYAGPLEQVVVSPYRPRLAPGVRWLPSDPLTPNRKVGHLLYALEVLQTQGRVVLAVDADVAVTGALVEGLAAPIASGSALSTAAPTPVDPADSASRAMAGLLRYTHHSFRALDVMSAGAKAVCGKALGLSPVATEALKELADHIGEDLELSKRLHARGLDVALSPSPAVVPLGTVSSWSTPLARFTRWMQVLASHRPALFPTVPLLFTPTLPLVLLAVVLGAPVLAGAVGVLVVVRTLLALRLAVLSAPAGTADTGLPYALTDWLLGEGLLLAAFLCSLWQQGTVTWRGRTYALQPGGRMVRVWPELSGGPG